MKLTGKQKKKLEEKCAFHPEVDPEHMEEKFQEYVRGEHQEYHCLKGYEKKIIPFRAYENYAEELEQRDASIQFLNEVIASRDEYIKSMETLIQKYHRNPFYRMYNGMRKQVRQIRGRERTNL